MRITDFGLAKFLDGKSDFFARTVCGTETYMPPEMLLSKKYNEAVDWSRRNVKAIRMEYMPWECHEIFRQTRNRQLTRQRSLRWWNAGYGKHIWPPMIIEADIGSSMRGSCEGTTIGIAQVCLKPCVSQVGLRMRALRDGQRRDSVACQRLLLVPAGAKRGFIVLSS